MKDGLDCASAPGICIVGFMSTDPKSTFKPVSFPITFDASKRPMLAVTPTTSLEDGQAIEVRGSNLGSATVSFGECLEDQWASCAYGEATTDADGNFVATFAAASRLDLELPRLPGRTGRVRRRRRVRDVSRG